MVPSEQSDSSSEKEIFILAETELHPNPRVGVAVFIIRDGKFLVGKRKGSHGDGSWTVMGGHVEFGETLEQTSAREVLEETGCEITDIRFGAITNDIFLAENKHYLTVWMLSNWKSGEPEIREPDKLVELCWVDFDNLPEPLFLPWGQLKKSEFINNIKQEVAKSLGRNKLSDDNRRKSNR